MPSSGTTRPGRSKRLDVRHSYSPAMPMHSHRHGDLSPRGEVGACLRRRVLECADLRPPLPWGRGRIDDANASSIRVRGVPRSIQPASQLETSMPALTSLPAWKALQTHRDVIGENTLRQLFDHDPDRGLRFTAEAEGVFLDFSKNR